MSLRTVISVVAVALTGLAARAFRRRRRMVLKLLKRRAVLTEMVTEADYVLRKVQRELTYGSNPPGSGSKKKPTATLVEVAILRARVTEVRGRMDDLQTYQGLMRHLQVKKSLGKLSPIHAEATKVAKEVQAFGLRVSCAREAGEILP
jgi:hypothetical protein